MTRQQHHFVSGPLRHRCHKAVACYCMGPYDMALSISAILQILLFELFSFSFQKDVVECTENGIFLNDLDQVFLYLFFLCLVLCLFVCCMTTVFHAFIRRDLFYICCLWAQVFEAIKRNVMEEGGGSHFRFLRIRFSFIFLNIRRLSNFSIFLDV